jgi:hypothetical protein
MTDDELSEAVVWLYASDCGLVRVAGHEPTLHALARQAVWDRLIADEDQLRMWVSRLARDVFLSDEALGGGYGIDDACDFWTWFDRTMWTRSVCGADRGPADAFERSSPVLGERTSPDPAWLVWPALQSAR